MIFSVKHFDHKHVTNTNLTAEPEYTVAYEEAMANKTVF